METRDCFKDARSQKSFSDTFSQRGWWNGFITCFTLLMMIQDWLGRDAWVELEIRAWRNTHWWFWLILLVFLAATHAVVVVKERRESDRECQPLGSKVTIAVTPDFKLQWSAAPSGVNVEVRVIAPRPSKSRTVVRELPL